MIKSLHLKILDDSLAARKSMHQPFLKVVISSSSQFSNSDLFLNGNVSSNDKNPIYVLIYFFLRLLFPDTRVCNGGDTLHFDQMQL